MICFRGSSPTVREGVRDNERANALPNGWATPPKRTGNALPNGRAPNTFELSLKGATHHEKRLSFKTRS